ncbi:MAG: hypothetical protein N4A49_02855 [Marinifilaceae bacterium]|jgi:hypothetical protein|nr:hypothetical protein [Marinifilaceae bacterium]
MASRRRLKKDIDYLCYAVLGDCYTYNYLHPEKREDVMEIIQDTIKSRNDLIARVNHPDGKNNPKMVKQHYKAIVDDLFKNIDASFTKLSEVIKK